MPPRSVRSFVYVTAPCLLCTVVGFGAGLLLSEWKKFEFAPTVALGQVLQIAALLLVFVLANHFYTRFHDHRRKRAEILVDMVSEVLSRVDEAHSSFVQCQQHKQIPPPLRRKLDGAFTDYSNALFELEQILPANLQTGGTPSFEDLKKNRRVYKDVVTGSPYPISIPKERFQQESKCYTLVRANLRTFQVQLIDV